MKELFNDGNVKLSLSYFEELPFLHVEVKTFSKDLYKKYLVVFQKALQENGLTTVYSQCANEKGKKFNELFGFEYLCNIEGQTIMEYCHDRG
jgi:hypothetical protein